jgi:hypothetical protein
MPPRKTTDFGALFAALIEDLRIQVAASIDRGLGDITKRLARLERRLEALDQASVSPVPIAHRRLCALCSRRQVARGLCSAHYQQLRYREKKDRPKQRLHKAAAAVEVDSNTLLLTPRGHDVSRDN